MEAFVADRREDKRDRLVERLLADDRNYTEHWLSFWNDLLRNDYKGTGYIDGGRKQITHWLYSALLTNMPYDKFVAELVNPTPDSEGFTKGIVWRGVVNASQTPQMQTAQNIAQVFMGVNLKCASCHDSFINDLTLADAYGLAGIYADGPLEMVHCDKPTGQKAELKFLYPELGAIDPKADKPARLKRLAEIITQRQDARLTRTLVNRLWQRFMGRGLIEPVDDMEKAAWNPDLLDWLAEDFAAHNYDVKHLIRQILTSRAYQLPAVNLGEQQTAGFCLPRPGGAPAFGGAVSRRADPPDRGWLFLARSGGHAERIRAKAVCAANRRQMDLERSARRRQGQSRARLFPQDDSSHQGSRGRHGGRHLRQQFYPLPQWQKGRLRQRFQGGLPV